MREPATDRVFLVALVHFCASKAEIDFAVVEWLLL